MKILYSRPMQLILVGVKFEVAIMTKIWQSE